MRGLVLVRKNFPVGPICAKPRDPARGQPTHVAGAPVGLHSQNSHHKLSGRASPLGPQGRKLRHGEAGTHLSLYSGKGRGVDLNSQLFGPKAGVLSTVLLTRHPRGLLILQEYAQFLFVCCLLFGLSFLCSPRSPIPYFTSRSPSTRFQ